MPPRAWRVRVQDMLDAVRNIRRLTAGLTREQFEQEDERTWAVLYQFIVLGEAARAVPPEICQRHPQIAWDDAKAFRNVITHIYFAVKIETVWQTIQNDLPMLEDQLRSIIESD